MEISKEELYDYYITQNHSRLETAEHFGVNPNTLRHLYDKYGIKKSKSKKVELSKRLSIERYGVDNPAKAQVVKDKIVNTNLQRYGAKNPWSKDSSVRHKCIDTLVERYGSKSPIQNKEIKQKIQSTNLKKYGSVSPFGSKDIIDKARQSKINNGIKRRLKYYNSMTDSLSTSNHKLTISELARDVGLAYSTTQRLATDFGLRDKMSIYESYLENLFKDILDSLSVDYIMHDRTLIKPYELDFYLEDLGIAFEVNDNGTHIGKDEYHQLKRDLCKSKCIDLYFIWEDNLIYDYEDVANDIADIINCYR